MRWFEDRLPPSGVTLKPLRTELLGLAIAGPQGRTLLSRAVKGDVSKATFPFLSIRKMDVGLVPALVARISFTGDLGYEIWVAPDCLMHLYQTLEESGRDLGLVHYGARALHAMRLEKSFGTWAREYRPIYTAFEAGLERFVDLEKGEFVGRAAVLRHKAEPPARRLIALTVDDKGVDAIGDEPIWHAGKVIGWVTSGGYGHTVGRSLALGYVDAAVAKEIDQFEVEIMGMRCPARRLPAPLFDPTGARMRA
jgi:dimethylglycine dehydrogenase